MNDLDITSTVSQAIKNFVFLSFSPDPSFLREELKEKVKNLGTMTKSLDFVISKNEYRRRRELVKTLIEPERKRIINHLSISKRTFTPIIELTPYVPKNRVSIVTNGIFRFFQGDFCSALSILGLQLENSLRYILESNNVCSEKPPRERESQSQFFYTLSQMVDTRYEFNAFRTILEEEISKSVMFEIVNLFHSPHGPSFRHRLAHGQVSWEEFHTPDAIYACWFILHFYCLPLLPNWDNVSQKMSVRAKYPQKNKEIQICK